MADQLSLSELRNAVAGKAAAFRARMHLQPAGGAGEKIFPPTFADAVYAIEYRRLPGHDESVRCVVLDSVQSQANRMEAALQSAWETGRISLPVVAVDFPAKGLIEPVGRVTTLEAPHRIADAIFRDSVHDGTAFRDSAVGKELNVASPHNATPLYRLCPTALVWGLWGSTGPKGGLGAKFERAVASEIVGIDVPEKRENGNEKRYGLRRDPLNISRNVLVRGTRDGWEVVTDGKTKSTKRPSEINHGNVPFGAEDGNAGVTVAYAELTTTLSLICLRRLQFPTDQGQDDGRDVAARTVLAALALTGASLAFEQGFDLRSRCVLWPEESLTWELLDRPGGEPQRFHLEGDAAIALLRDAIRAASDVGLEWRVEPIVLEPSANLLDLVRMSQEKLASSETEDI